MTHQFVAIDIGGTTIKADVYDENGQSFHQFKEIDTLIDYEKQTNNILEQVIKIVEEYARTMRIDGIAISTAGVVDSDKGEITYAGYTIPNYTGTSFKEELHNRFNVPVAIANDVNCAVLGEYWQGIEQKYNYIYMITLGTGIGGSLIYNGHLVTGYSNTAGEVGYIPMGESDWQTSAATGALVQRFNEKSSHQVANGKEFFEYFDAGDPLAEEALDDYLDAVSRGLLTLVYTTNPQCLIVGGGIMARSDVILPRLRTKVAENVQGKQFMPENIVSAQVGNEAGRLGALYFLLQTMHFV